VRANQTMAEDESHDALEQIEGSGQANYLVVVPPTLGAFSGLRDRVRRRVEVGSWADGRRIS
jgi:hypothetical protein